MEQLRIRLQMEKSSFSGTNLNLNLRQVINSILTADRFQINQTVKCHFMMQTES